MASACILSSNTHRCTCIYLLYIILSPLPKLHQVSGWLQASISLVPIYQGVQLWRVRTPFHTAAPNTSEQHVHAVTNGYHSGCGLRPGWGRWRCQWCLWKEDLPVCQKEKLHHVSSHRDHWMQRWQCENAKWRHPKCSTWGFLLKGFFTDIHKEMHTQTYACKEILNTCIIHCTHKQCMGCLLNLNAEALYQSQTCRNQLHGYGY